MRGAFALVGFIAVADFIADGDFKWTKLSITEPVDAGKVIFNWGQRQILNRTPQ